MIRFNRRKLMGKDGGQSMLRTICDRTGLLRLSCSRRSIAGSDWKRLGIRSFALVVLVILCLGIPWIIRSFNTVSTDDAYVNSYVTFVAPRVTRQVLSVVVEDNNRVKKGDVLVQLDPEPYQVKLSIKQPSHG